MLEKKSTYNVLSVFLCFLRILSLCPSVSELRTTEIVHLLLIFQVPIISQLACLMYREALVLGENKNQMVLQKVVN